jgi:hypothetical protein
MTRFEITFDIDVEEYQEAKDVAERIKETLNLGDVTITKTWEISDEDHFIYSLADIGHEITYRLNEDENELVFNSMTRDDRGGGDGLDIALEHNLVHCICGEERMSKEEAVDHLKDSRDSP